MAHVHGTLEIIGSAAGCGPATEIITINPGPAELLNPGFEELDSTGAITGWENTGDVEAVLIEDNGYSDTFRLSHKAAASYIVETSQLVSELVNGWYTLSAWIRSSGQNEVYLALTCGGQEKRVYLPATTPGYLWVQLVVSNQVTDGQCTIPLHSFGTPDSWASFGEIELAPGQAALSILGAALPPNSGWGCRMIMIWMLPQIYSVQNWNGM